MISIDQSGIHASAFPAPMAGMTTPAFRQILLDKGCRVVCTEMVSAMGLVKQKRKTLEFLHFIRKPDRVSVQIFGSKPEIMSEAAKILEDLGAGIVDINMGCPVKKVAGAGCGLALMKNPPLACQIMNSVRAAVRIPVSVKLRLGWDRASANASDLVQIAADAGMSFAAVHARFRSNYENPADWAEIGRIKEIATIPIVGNGDVTSPEDAADMIRRTGCDAVMVGRGMLGNPWLPAQIERFLESGEMPPSTSMFERMRTFMQHLDLTIEQIGEIRACFQFRKHAALYLKGISSATRLRKEIYTFTSRSQYAEMAERMQFT
jgi:tRNA-dihydrouridine synthase B